MEEVFSVLSSGCCLSLTTVIERDFEDWVCWLRDSNWTRNLQSVDSVSEHTIDSQISYFETEVLLGRQWFAVRETISQRLIGVLSLVPLGNENSHFTIIMGEMVPQNPLATLESIALLVQYAFESTGTMRIEGGVKSTGFRNYLMRLMILGFIPEGLKSDDWRREGVIEDTIQFGITRKLYQEMLNQRNGKYWLGTSAMQDLLHRFEKFILQNNIGDVNKIRNDLRNIQTTYIQVLKVLTDY